MKEPTAPGERVHLGRRLEGAAARFLQGRGCRLLSRNYYCRHGEMDLVMLDPGGRLLFVEVRSRGSNRFCTAAETLGPAKLQRLRRTAAHYLRRHPSLAARPCRFDIIAFDRHPSQTTPHLSWLKDAFN